VIGAGAVVTKDIPPFSVAVGVPAKVIQQRKNMDEPLAEVGSFQIIG
jgi:acetyltransferase-like isoleucine patch superfamily enzyme